MKNNRLTGVKLFFLRDVDTRIRRKPRHVIHSERSDNRDDDKSQAEPHSRDGGVTKILTEDAAHANT